MPRVLYAADLSSMSKNRLKTADMLIRRAVRKWCHLHKSMSHGLFYARCNDGGVGMMKVSGEQYATSTHIQAKPLYRANHLLHREGKVQSREIQKALVGSKGGSIRFLNGESTGEVTRSGRLRRQTVRTSPE